MDYLVALPPELGLSADEFAVSWNEVPECSAVGEATFAEGAVQQQIPTAEVARLSNVAEDINSTLLAELIKQAFHAQGIIKALEVSQEEHSDGSPLFLVRDVEA